ncbi:hypothetical protein AGOR_G00252240 [Albula goreensis]|uniref:Uncharacterized protein n=1 Tax=Albula goreensis TaxID=1534307 RepID=A0A8T3CGY4_9TELE|nr:hypothetical protein AGOR_G00252240 [Albula goreensis]
MRLNKRLRAPVLNSSFQIVTEQLTQGEISSMPMAVQISTGMAKSTNERSDINHARIPDCHWPISLFPASPIRRNVAKLVRHYRNILDIGLTDCTIMELCEDSTPCIAIDPQSEKPCLSAVLRSSAGLDRTASSGAAS